MHLARRNGCEVVNVYGGRAVRVASGANFNLISADSRFATGVAFFLRSILRIVVALLGRAFALSRLSGMVWKIMVDVTSAIAPPTRAIALMLAKIVVIAVCVLSCSCQLISEILPEMTQAFRRHRAYPLVPPDSRRRSRDGGCSLTG